MKNKKKSRLAASLIAICTLIYAGSFLICYIEEGKSLLYSLLMPLMTFGAVAGCIIVAWLIAHFVMEDE